MRDFIKRIITAKLTSVEFVHDYVQLRFDGLCLTINAPFEVSALAKIYRKGEIGFRDALCDRIGHHIERATTSSEDFLDIDFEDSSKVRISLRADDQVGPEAAVLSDESGQICVW